MTAKKKKKKGLEKDNALYDVVQGGGGLKEHQGNAILMSGVKCDSAKRDRLTVG